MLVTLLRNTRRSSTLFTFLSSWSSDLGVLYILMYLNALALLG